MLKVFDANRGVLGGFFNYEKPILFIESERKVGQASSDQTNLWSFTKHTAEELKKMCALKRPEYITLFESKALENHFGLIEMRKGSGAPLRQIIIDQAIDVVSFQKSWCLEYCCFRKRLLIEIEKTEQALGTLVSCLASSSPLEPYVQLFQKSLFPEMSFSPANFSKVESGKKFKNPNQRLRLVGSQVPDTSRNQERSNE